jgi:endoglucanase
LKNGRAAQALLLALIILALIIPALINIPSSLAATSQITLPLSTRGNDIVDARGSRVLIQGVNWFGFETANHAPHGLWIRDYRDMLKQIKQQGFNTIRLPFSLTALKASTTTGIDYSNGKNAALAGKTPQQVMDIIIKEAGRQGLMVILDNHSQADDGFMYDLWYGQDGYTERDWISAWSALAKRYARMPQVIGADLKNEPHGRATWGTGGPTDWRRAAQRAGNAVLAQNPHLLVIVEGIESPLSGGKLDRHWWGGNLEGVRRNPVTLKVKNQLVYSPHEYGPEVFAQPWFSESNMSAILKQRWQAGFGYIHEQKIAPVFVGEFGAKQVSTDTVEGRWFREFTDYLASTGMSWSFWAWNPNSGDTGGILQEDWITINQAKMDVLSELIRRQKATVTTRRH